MNCVTNSPLPGTFIHFLKSKLSDFFGFYVVVLKFNQSGQGDDWRRYCGWGSIGYVHTPTLEMTGLWLDRVQNILCCKIQKKNTWNWVYS